MLIPAAIGSAVFGFVISLIFTLFSGATFGDILLRPLITGLLFGGIGAGIAYFLESQFPDIFQSAAAPRKAEEDGEQGSRVDIVLPSEEPEIYGSPVEEVNSGEIDDGVEEISANPAPSPNPEESMDFNEPQESDGPSKGEPVVSPSQGGPLPSSDQLVEDQEDLPDLGAFASSFQQGDAEENQEESAPTGASPASEPEGGDQSSTVTFDGEEHDPEIMARAVQHALKSDRGGS
jgi:hypothetical protein